MARRNPLPESERQICQRLRLFRIKRTGMTAVEFARRLDIDSNRLSSYEHGRVPLRYELANKICQEFNVCQRWLAEGKEPERYFVLLKPILRQQIAPRAIFSEVYQQILKPLLDEHLKSLRHLWGGEMPKEGLIVVQELGQNAVGGVDPAFVLNYSCRHMAELIGTLPPDLYQSFFNDLMTTKRGFLLKHRQRIEAWRNAPKETVIPEWAESETKNKGLTDVSESVNDIGVNPRLPSLLDRLKRATAQRGKKSKLAKFLGVSLVQVSQWLSGDREPGGETTLRMLHWIELQERQK